MSVSGHVDEPFPNNLGKVVVEAPRILMGPTILGPLPHLEDEPSCILGEMFHLEKKVIHTNTIYSHATSRGSGLLSTTAPTVASLSAVCQLQDKFRNMNLFHLIRR